jgi:cell wall-associated NlpC family hydrolase
VIIRGLALVAAFATLSLAWIATATASTPAPPQGRLRSVVLDTFDHRLTVTGWASDPARGSAAVSVNIFVDGTFAGSARADDRSPGVDKAYHLRGNHDFARTISWTKAATTVSVRTRGVRSMATPATAFGSRAVQRFYPSAGARIVSVAQRYVGRARYVEGGASPRGFDCSGYTAYAYAQAHVKTLPHNAEGQRRVKGMRRISRAAARPGDLVFYLSGGSAYHVAIYAGHGMQYAAATARDGVRYQAVWSTAVQYGTDWH